MTTKALALILYKSTKPCCLQTFFIAQDLSPISDLRISPFQISKASVWSANGNGNLFVVLTGKIFDAIDLHSNITTGRTVSIKTDGTESKRQWSWHSMRIVLRDGEQGRLWQSMIIPYTIRITKSQFSKSMSYLPSHGCIRIIRYHPPHRLDVRHPPQRRVRRRSSPSS